MKEREEQENLSRNYKLGKESEMLQRNQERRMEIEKEILEEHKRKIEEEEEARGGIVFIGERARNFTGTTDQLFSKKKLKLMVRERMPDVEFDPHSERSKRHIELMKEQKRQKELRLKGEQKALRDKINAKKQLRKQQMEDLREQQFKERMAKKEKLKQELEQKEQEQAIVKHNQQST